MSEATGVLRVGRLLVIIVMFVVASRLIPTGGALSTSPLVADRGEDLLKAFDGADRAIVGRGRSHDLVGTIAPSLSFASFQGGTLSFDDLSKAVALVFVGPDCPRCAPAAQKLATLSVIYYEDIVAGTIASSGSAIEIAQLLDDVGGTGLLLGGEDRSDEVAAALQIEARPTLVVVGPSGTVDAVWSEDVPLNLLYGFLKTAYDFEGEGEKPADPFPDSGVRDG